MLCVWFQHTFTIWWSTKETRLLFSFVKRPWLPNSSKYVFAIWSRVKVPINSVYFFLPTVGWALDGYELFNQITRKIFVARREGKRERGRPKIRWKDNEDRDIPSLTERNGYITLLDFKLMRCVLNGLYYFYNYRYFVSVY